MTDETVSRPGEAPSRPDEPQGGDPACWLDRVCPECGAFTERGFDTCPRCGSSLADADERA